MKFWHKMLFIMLALFIASLDISVITIMKKSQQLNLEREIQRSSSEQTLIGNSIYENFTGIASRGVAMNDDIYHAVTLSYAKYYSEQGVELQLWKENTIVFSNQKINLSRPPAAAIQKISHKGVPYIQISKMLPEPYDDLMLVYQRDVSSMASMQSSLNRFFIIINFLVGICLIFILYIAAKKLTGPLRQLSEATKQIANGDYKKRVVLKSNDEFGDLARNFNKMADIVEEHIRELFLEAEEKQRMVDNLAHELRTPLTSMQGFAEYLLNARLTAEDSRVASSYILSETIRLKKLAFKLLDISRLRQEPVKMDVINTASLFGSVLNIEKRKLEKEGIELDVSSTIEALTGDVDLLTSFLVNCIENAIHASNRGAQIKLSAYEEEGRAVLEVRDDGCGMSEEQIQKAFEPFYRADRSRSRSHGGAGLGLALCRQIAEAHHATLDLQSKPGEGTKIRIFLQLHNNFSETP